MRDQCRCILSNSILAFCIVLSFGVNRVVSQSIRVEKLFVEDPRPIAKAVEILAVRHAWRMTYEDPPYVYANDVIDKTVNPVPGLPRALSPIGGRIDFDYEVPRSGKPDPAALIQKVFDAHMLRGNPGTFSVKQRNETFHIVPAQIKDNQGRLVDITPVLDTTITIPRLERNLADTFRTVFSAVDQKTQAKILFGSIPANLFIYTKTIQEATNEPARDVLLRALDATKIKLSWKLFYDPGTKKYYINVHLSMYETHDPTGRKVLQELK